jgi:PIN domain nuclease of toxin-antitoxin system
MKMLLDTHVFLWFIDGNSNLKERVRSLILDSNNQRFLSVASLWELAIKRSLGKLKLDFSFTELMMEHIQGNDIQILHIKPGHLDVVNGLPFHHRDPLLTA